MFNLISSFFFIVFFTSFFSQNTRQNAHSFYNQQRYDKAFELYKKAIEQTPSEDNFYNLANTAYKNGDYAYAIWAFEKVLKLNPSHKNALYNLEIANQNVQDEFPIMENRLGKFWQTKTFISRGFWPFLACVLMGLTIVLYGFKNRLKFAFYKTTLGLSLCCFLQFNALKWYGSKHKYAIVQSGVVHAKNAPSTHSSDAVILHSGSKVEVIQHQSNWVEVAIGERYAWVQKKDVRLI